MQEFDSSSPDYALNEGDILFFTGSGPQLARLTNLKGLEAFHAKVSQHTTSATELAALISRPPESQTPSASPPPPPALPLPQEG